MIETKQHENFLSEYDELDRAEQLEVCEDLQERAKLPEIAGYAYEYDDSDDYEYDELDDEISEELKRLPSLDAMGRCCNRGLIYGDTGGKFDQDRQDAFRQKLFEMLVDYAEQVLVAYGDLELGLSWMSEYETPRSIVEAAMRQMQARLPSDEDLRALNAVAADGGGEEEAS